MLDEIKEICKTKGITIQDLEAAVGVSKNAMYRWDKNAPSVDKVKAVADYLGVSVDTLLGRTTADEIREQAFNARPELRMLWDMAENMKPEDVAWLIEKAKRLTDV